mgnify:FL=1|tara:strand:+ start:479 stop:697 length:219 start_codon:yes stop_codon:yes gene_type:complete
MKKIKKIKIRLNGKNKTIKENEKLSDLIKSIKIPIKKVAIELNQKIVEKKKLNRIFLKSDDKIEIVHFIGGG